MKEKIFILSFFLFALSAGIVYAQTNAIDSLNSLLKESEQDSTRANLLNSLSREYFKIDEYDSVYSIAQKAAELSRQIHHPKGEARAYRDLGWYYTYKNNYKMGMEYANKAMQLYRTIHFKNGEGLVYLLMANSALIQGKYDSARYFVDNALEIFKKTNYKSGSADAISALGNLYYLKSDYRNAVSKFFEAMKIYDELGDRYGASLIYQSLAEYYRNQKVFDKAKTYLHKQLSYFKKINNYQNIGSVYIGLGNIHQDEKNYDSALYYLGKAQQIYDKTNDRYSLGIVLNNIGDVYRLSGSFDRALKFYEKSLAICYEINDIEGTVYPLDGMGVIYTRMGNFDKAADNLSKARKTAESLNIPALLVDNYLHTSQLDSATQNFPRAYEMFKKHSYLKDSLQDSQNAKAIAEIQAQFESEKKDQEISFLNEEKKLKESQRNRERNAYLIGLFITVSFIGALLYNIFQKIKTGRILKSQKNEISQKNEELNQMNEELKTVLETIEAQNHVLAEKNEKLEDLNLEKDGLIGVVAHDLRSPLTKTAGLVDLITLTGPLNQQQQEMIELIKKVCGHGNSLINDLLEINSVEGREPEEPSMSIVDISSYLDAFVMHHQSISMKKNIKIILEKDHDGSTVMTNAEYLTRILDNLVSNAIKFSQTNTTIHIKSTMKDNRVSFSVSDEGPGISEEDRPNLFKKFKRLSAKPTGGESSTGLGLSIVKALVIRLKGNITVESIPGKGSTFTFEFPSFNLAYSQ